MYYVYWWRDQYRDLLKIGYGQSPQLRMQHYADKYSLTPEPSSLNMVPMRSRLAAIYAEQALLFLLPRFGFTIFPWPAAVGYHESQELFDIAGREYRLVSQDMRRQLVHILAVVPPDRDMLTENNATRMAFRRFG